MTTYPALPSARRRHYEIDGAVVGYNASGFGTGMTSILSGASMLALNEETPTIDSAVIGISNGTTIYVYVLFPELADLTQFITRFIHSGDGSGNGTISNLQGSPDTTTGADGTWTAITNSGTACLVQNYDHGDPATDWWRSTAPASLTANNTGLKAIRFQLANSGANNASLRNLYLWGAKHSGETADDIIFLESDGTTEWPNDDDLGNIAAGGSPTTHTYYVKNVSPTKTANTITVKASGSDSAQWQVSLDNASFASSKPIASLAPGATQVVYFKFTPPSPAAGVYRPYAAYLEADVTSWT